VGERLKSSLFKTLYGVILLVFLSATIFPFYWIVNTSLKTREEIYATMSFLPLKPTLENYIATFAQNNFGTYLSNSLTVTVTTAGIVLVVSILGGYSLARYTFKGKNVIMAVLLITQMIPLITAIIPMFSLYSRLRLTDTLYALIISYTVSNIPFCLITMSAFFKRIPITLEEAALIDGCGRFSCVTRVVLPVMTPGIVAVFVFAFTGCWNELFFAIMMINNDKRKTIPVGLINFVQKYEINWGQMTAACAITLVPVILMFFFVQKYIVAGLTQGAVKE